MIKSSLFVFISHTLCFNANFIAFDVIPISPGNQVSRRQLIEDDINKVIVYIYLNIKIGIYAA